MIFLKLFPGIVLFISCIFLFFRETRLDHERYLEQDRLGDEHIMREIEKFIKEQAVLKSTQEL